MPSPQPVTPGRRAGWNPHPPRHPGRYRYSPVHIESPKLLDVEEIGGALFVRELDRPSYVPVQQFHGWWHGPLQESI